MRVPTLILTLLVLVLAIALPLASPAQDLSAGEDAEPVQFRIDGDSSWLRVLVYRGGLLRGFGHNGCACWSIAAAYCVASDTTMSFPTTTLRVRLRSRRTRLNQL